MRISPQRTELAKMRVAAKIPQKEMADRLRVSTGHLQMCELGKRNSTALFERAKRELGR